MVTSKGIDGVTLTKNAFPHLFALLDTVVVADDTANHRPHPEPLLLAASRVGVLPENSCYVGDTVHDMQAARAAGMKGIAISWGADSREVLLRESSEYWKP